MIRLISHDYPLILIYLSLWGELGKEERWLLGPGVSRSLVARLAARGLIRDWAQESSELKLLPLASLRSRLTSLLPTLIPSFSSMDPEGE